MEILKIENIEYSYSTPVVRSRQLKTLLLPSKKERYMQSQAARVPERQPCFPLWLGWTYRIGVK
jgi:hypothetical protein